MEEISNNSVKQSIKKKPSEIINDLSKEDIIHIVDTYKRRGPKGLSRRYSLSKSHILDIAMGRTRFSYDLLESYSKNKKIAKSKSKSYLNNRKKES